MMTSRKQQREIELATKKVQDGVAEFSTLWQKVEDAEDAKDRDKWMADMKRELKRLQRLRDQFRTWAEDPSIRDHTPLLEMRRAVEVQMERFKDLEKEAKIKPFAKAGLSQREKMDPSVMAKMECEAWLQSAINRLAEQMEQFEADSEALCSGVEDSKRPPEKVAELQGFIKQHEGQTAKLEQVLRLVENEQVSPEEVNETLKESMEHYLASSTEPDFVEDELMYEGLPLGEGLENVGRIQAHDSRMLAAVNTTVEAPDHSAEGTPKEGIGKSGKAKQGAGKSALGGKRAGKQDGQKSGEKRSRSRSVTSPCAASVLPTPFKEAAAKAIVSTPAQPPGFPAPKAVSQQPPTLPSARAASGPGGKGAQEESANCAASMPPAVPASPRASAPVFTPRAVRANDFSYEEAWPKPVAPTASTEAPACATLSAPEDPPQQQQPHSPQQQPQTPRQLSDTPARSDPTPNAPCMPSGSQDVMGSPVWHLRNPELSAALKGMRSSTTAQLLHGLSMPPTSPLLRAEQAADAYLQNMSPTRYAMNQVQGLEYGVEEVARQMHGFNAQPLPSQPTFSPTRQQAAQYNLAGWPSPSAQLPRASPQQHFQQAQALLASQTSRHEPLGGRYLHHQTIETTPLASLQTPPGLSEAASHPVQPTRPDPSETFPAGLEQMSSPFSRQSTQQAPQFTFGEGQQPSPLTRLRRVLDMELQARKQGTRGASSGHPWVGNVALASTPSIASALEMLDRQFQIQWCYQTSPGDWAKVDEILTLLEEREPEPAAAQIQAVYPKRQQQEHGKEQQGAPLAPEPQNIDQQDFSKQDLAHDSVLTKLRELKERFETGPTFSKTPLQPTSHQPPSPVNSSHSAGSGSKTPLHHTKSAPAHVRRRSLDIEQTERQWQLPERKDNLRLTSSLDPEGSPRQGGLRRAVTPDADLGARSAAQPGRGARAPGRTEANRHGQPARGFPLPGQTPQILQRGRGLHRAMSARGANEIRSPSPVVYRSTSPRLPVPRHSPVQPGGPFVPWRPAGVQRADSAAIAKPPPPPPPPRQPSAALPASLMTSIQPEIKPPASKEQPPADPLAYSLLDVEHLKPYWGSSIRKQQEANLLASGKKCMPQDVDRSYTPPHAPVSVFDQPRQNPVGNRQNTWPLRDMWTQDAIPLLNQPDFFERVPMGTWPEVALFAVFFQPGSLQQKHAAELLKSQGWVFHRDLQRWFYRPDNAATQQDQGADPERDEWVYWDPNMGPSSDGWCARQTLQGAASSQQNAPSVCAL